MENREPGSKPELLTTVLYTLPRSELPGAFLAPIIWAAGGDREDIRNSTFDYFAKCRCIDSFAEILFQGFRLSKDFLNILSLIST